MTLKWQTGETAKIYGKDGSTDAGELIEAWIPQEITSNVDLSSSNVNRLLYKNTGGTPEVVCKYDTDITTGGRWVVANKNADDVRISEGSGVILSRLTGSAVETGDFLLSQGGVARVVKLDDSNYLVWAELGTLTQVTSGRINSRVPLIFVNAGDPGISSSGGLFGNVSISGFPTGALVGLAGLIAASGLSPSAFGITGTVVQDSEITEGGTVYIVDFTNGTDAGAGNTWATRWKTIAYLEANLPSSATAVYFVEGGETSEDWTAPTTHGGTSSNPFIGGACYRSGSTTFRRNTSTYTNMPIFNGGVANPTTRTYTNGILVRNVSNVRLENLKVVEQGGLGVRIDKNDGVNNQDNYDNPYENFYLYNLHLEGIAQNGTLCQFVKNITIDHCFLSDIGRVEQVLGDNAGGITFIGCSQIKILTNDVLFVKGEAVNLFWNNSDFYIHQNWVYGGSAVTLYLDASYQGVVHANALMAAPSSEANHLTQPGATEGFGSDLRGEATGVTFEQTSFNTSWTPASANPANLLFLCNMGLGTSDGIVIGQGDLTSGTPNWDSIDEICNLYAGNSDQFDRNPISVASYTNNVHKGNIHLNAGVSGAQNVDTSSSGQGLDADYNYWTDSTPTGNFSGANDLTSGLNMTKTTGFNNLTFQISAPTDPRGWGDIRADGELLALADIRPKSDSTTIGAGPPRSEIVLPSGVTVVTLPEILKDFDGRALSDPLDMGPFSAQETPSGDLTGNLDMLFGLSGTMSGPNLLMGASSSVFALSGTVAGGSDATIAYVDAVQTSTTSASTSWSCNIPSGAAAGDLAFVVCTEISGTNSLNTLPSGWTQIGPTLSPGSDSSNILMWHTLDSSDITAGSFTFTNLWTNAQTGSIEMICYRNHAASPINTSNSASGYVDVSANVIGPAITPTRDNCMIVQFISCDADTSGYAAAPAGSPTGTERVDTTDIYNRQYIYVQDYLQSSAASISLEANIDQSDTYARWQVAIAPTTV